MNKNTWRNTDGGGDNPYTWHSAGGEDDDDNPNDYPPDPEDSGNEDMTEPEPIDIPADIPVEDLPRFRILVRNKKLELKAQFGKRRLVLRRCGPKPARVWARYNPPWVRTNNNKDKYDANTDDFNRDLSAWNTCRSGPRGWQPGWRKKWRQFRQGGGLAQLKLQAKGMAPVGGGGTGGGTGGGGFNRRLPDGSNDGGVGGGGNNGGGGDDNGVAKSSFSGIMSPRTWLKCLLIVMVLHSQVPSLSNVMTVIFTLLLITTTVYYLINNKLINK